MKWATHGDVVLKEIKELPEGVKEVPRINGRVIIAEGEVTGHAHAIVDDNCTLYEKEGKLYLVNTKEVTITHEEHRAKVIPAKIWEIDQSLEYDYDLEEARRVAD